MNSESNPFGVGDELVFAPDARAVGWYQHSFKRWQIYPGYVGRVTRTTEDQVELDGKAEAAMHWSQFRRTSDIPVKERERLREEYLRTVK